MQLNHGLALSGDGKKLYASSVESVFAWDYDAAAGTTSGGSATVVTGMRSDDLVTRTLLMSKKHDGMLVVSRGSGEDLDPDALNIASGLGQIKAFDLSNLTSSSAPYDFDSAGRRLGWGLRNAVGVAEHPVTGGIYSVENSIDGATRNGVDIHKDNPGEELNFHGFLNGSTEDQGGNYGYPSCYALWDKSIPDAQGLDVGSQFSMAQNSTLNDDICSSDFVAPRLTFPAHYAPLDIKFTSDGATAYITFHGSCKYPRSDFVLSQPPTPCHPPHRPILSRHSLVLQITDALGTKKPVDKTNPVGYRLTSVAFDGSSGAPVAAADSTQALSDIMSNVDPSKCPGSCFRPVGIAIDSSGRVFMTSDSTGEIYVLVKSAGTPSSTASGTIVTATGSPNSAAGLWNKASAVLGGVLAAAAAVVVSI